MPMKRLYLLYNSLTLLLLLFSPSVSSQSLKGFAEFGATVNLGENVPLWQASLQHGLSSIKSNAYMRGAVVYNDTIGSCRVEGALDIAVAAGQNATFIPQQFYISAAYKWLSLWAGSRELCSPLLNSRLSSGGLTWSGNARPIPQIMLCTPGYVAIAKRVSLKAELSYGWFTDGHYQQTHVADKFMYNKKVKYHHKSLFFRFGKPDGKWTFDLGIDADDQFGGYLTKDGETTDMNNGVKEYWRALVLHNGGDGVYFSGNYLGTEYLRLNYNFGRYGMSAYVLNFYDDMSGMAKRNGFDGLWGLEYRFAGKAPVNGVVVEYYQTTNQSGPLHGLDFSEVGKTGGADDYYNNDQYVGWSHWGMTMANPLVASPIYNGNGNLAFMYNRVKALHIAFSGDISSELGYRFKFSYNKSWGTPFKPIVNILNNFSTFAELNYNPLRMPCWNIAGSIAFDSGKLYGDNAGVQIKIKRNF